MEEKNGTATKPKMSEPIGKYFYEINYRIQILIKTFDLFKKWKSKYSILIFINNEFPLK